MTKRNTVLLTGVAVAALCLSCFAKGKTPTVTGMMVAYDPLLHAAKDASFVANKEVVILEATGLKVKYVKVVFVGYGTTQVEQKYFDGSTPVSARALRDRTCDEKDPRMVPQMELHQGAGTYLLTDAFKASPPPKIRNLECYAATEKK
jgi:hypothetical protein